MAITANTYSGLKSAVADWMARSDLTAAQLADCVLMFENVANRTLKCRQMEATDTLNTTLGVETLPTDYLAWRSLTWDADVPLELDYVHPAYLRASYPVAETGTPRWFTIEGTSITIRPYDDSNSFTLRYWQKIPALSSVGDGGTNWLLTQHPDVYLAGTLYTANAFIQNPEAATAYKGLMEEMFAQINMLSETTKAPMAVRVKGTIP